MYRIILLFTISLFPVCGLYADGGDYPVSAIPVKLLKKANAVIRMSETKFRILDTKEAVETEHFVITILNDKADDLANIVEPYSKLFDLESIEGHLYNANGEELKKVKKKDIQDLSGNSEDAMIDDKRYKHHNFYYRVYPYTIEYEIETRYKTTFFFPQWRPQSGEGISIQQSSFVLQFPADYKVRYKSYNYTGEPVAGTEKRDNLLTWSVSEVPAVWKETFSPRLRELTTTVLTGPSDFQMEDYKGNMESWNGLGKFVYELKQGRDELPADVKQKIHAIADNISDPKEKIARLYEYMQKNTRYIGIQLGIGGWQPFDAKEVASKGYGDCKALSNYMYSILKEENIPSYYTLIRAGNAENINKEFPAQQFNHVILCVPLKNDTMWLECTSQTKPAGYLGGFTCNRSALLIGENGGILVNTPKYSISENLQTRHIKAALDMDGSLKIDANTRYAGLQQDYYHGLMNSYSKEEIKKILHENLDFATYDINSFNYIQEKGNPPAINEKLDISVSNYATITGKRLFVVPNLMNRTARKLNQDSSRKYDIVIDFGYQDIDSVEIDLPSGFTPESVPSPVIIKSKFGNYSSSVTLSNNKLIYYRNIEHFEGHFPASDYTEMAKFYDTIFKADRAKLVLVKN